MCKEDIRVARESQSRTFFVALPLGNTTDIIGQNNNRIALSITLSGLVNIWVGPKGLGVTNSVGMLIAQTHPREVFTIEVYGNEVTKAWEGFPSGGGASVFVTETSWRDTANEN